MHSAPRNPASNNPMANSLRASSPSPAGSRGRRASAVCRASSIAIGGWWKWKAAPVVMMMKTATEQVSSEPASVSHLPNFMSWTSSPLSTTALCWKKICHGAIVVPMFASRMNTTSLENPIPCGR